MKILGFNFNKINIERLKGASAEKVDIKSSINIIDIDKPKFDLIKEGTPLSFKFNYSIDYEPEFAKMEFEGFVLSLFDEKIAKQILKDWKNKKISEDIKIQVFNIVFRKASIKALELEEDLDLPLHIPLPKISAPEKE